MVALGSVLLALAVAVAQKKVRVVLKVRIQGEDGVLVQNDLLLSLLLLL